LRVQSDVQRALDKAQFVNDLKQSAAIFGDEILNIMRAMEKKHQVSDAKWTGKLGNFLKKVYPVAKISLTIIGSMGSVSPLSLQNSNQKAANFAPVQWAADGLGLILQVWTFFSRTLTGKGMNEESGHADDFYCQLRRIEYQASRISTIDLTVESTRTLMHEKSLDLMTAIVKYLNGALIYFNSNFFGKPLRDLLT